MNNSEIKSDFKTMIKSEFEKLQNSLNGSSGSEINLARKDEFSSFFVKGIPTIKFENWKYTNLTFLNKLDLKVQDGSEDVSDINIKELYYSEVDSHKIVLVNGIYSKELSDFFEVDGLDLEIINTTSSTDLGKYSSYYGKLTHNSGHPFAEINTALSKSVLVIEIKENKVVDKPIQIINITDASKHGVFTNPRILVICKKSSSCKIIETNYTVGNNPGVKNIVKEIFLEENANLNYYKIQDDTEYSHTFDYTQAYQLRDSHFDEAAVSLNGKFIRNDLRTILDSENIESHYYGIFIGSNSDLIDNHTFVDHAKPNCYSNENYRGILFDKSTGVFNGKIMVRPDAQKTNAYQSNKNVLLSPYAVINTKPELEIYADDVKCSHGATSGALDENSKFYLQTRGIGEKQAEILLLNAFAAEVIGEIKIEKLRNLVLSRIEDKLNMVYN
ncbi:MAG: Fe-S cluster assembly protein SufD [Candidatus Kapaibacterium sp.]